MSRYTAEDLIVGASVEDVDAQLPENGLPPIIRSDRDELVAELTARGTAFNVEQARVPKNNPNGGEWKETPSTALAQAQAAVGGGHDYHDPDRPVVEVGSPEMIQRFKDFDKDGPVANGAEAQIRAYALTGNGSSLPTVVDQLPEGSDVMTRVVTHEGGAEQFRTGEHFPGHGFYGNGSYFGAGRGGGGRDQEVIHAAWKPDARVYELRGSTPAGVFRGDDIDFTLQRMNEAMGGTGDYWNGELESSALYDLGTAAALLGYDGINIPKPNGWQDSRYILVLNREALYVEKAKD